MQLSEEFSYEIFKDDAPLNPRQKGGKWATILTLGHLSDPYPEGLEYQHSLGDLEAEIKRQGPLASLRPLHKDGAGVNLLGLGRQIGFVFMTKDIAKKVLNIGRIRSRHTQLIERYIDSEVSDYANYLRGESYGYRLFDESLRLIDEQLGYFDEAACRQAAETRVRGLTGELD